MSSGHGGVVTTGSLAAGTGRIGTIAGARVHPVAKSKTASNERIPPKPNAGILARVRPTARELVQRYAPLVVATAILAYWSISAIRGKTGGEPAVPLDDAFIHFRYARALAEGHPLVYSPGDPPTSGATSLLWSSLLAPFWKLGFRELSLIWIAWTLSFVSLALLALETRRLAARLLPRGSAIGAGAMVLAFGGHVWCAGSGMEVIPFAFLLMRTARLCAEVYERRVEGDGDEEPLPPVDWRRAWDTLIVDEVDPQTRAPTRRLHIELATCGALLPLMRPEGAVVASFASLTLFLVHRRLALAPLAGVALPLLVMKLATGSASTTTARVKWLLFSPYLDSRAFWDKTLTNVYVLFAQLFDGNGPARTFLPNGFFFAMVLAFPALLFAVKRRGHAFRALCVAVAALCIVIPCTYDSFLANRLRYVWPFTAAWMIALAAIGDAAATLALRLDDKLAALRMIVVGVLVLVMGGQLGETIDDLAVSAAGVHDQQVALARWARGALPTSAIVGVNDAGAMTYLGERRTFDIVGLTTRDEARYWVAGSGSRFEHYERMPRERLPTHLVVYPQWFEIGPVLGTKLTERTVEGATVLGAPTMLAHEASWSPWLGSGELPIHPSGALVDALDVADLESEAEHRYELRTASRSEDALVVNDKRIDGARLNRELDRFDLRLTPGGRLVLRVGTTMPLSFAVLRVDGNEAKKLELAADPWQELSFDVPEGVPEGVHRIEVAAAPGQRFLSMHYWSFR